jgi:hypothetical protein
MGWPVDKTVLRFDSPGTHRTALCCRDIIVKCMKTPNRTHCSSWDLWFSRRWPWSWATFVTLCTVIQLYWCFIGNSHLHPHGRNGGSSFPLKTVFAACFFRSHQMSVQYKWRKIMWLLTVLAESRYWRLVISQEPTGVICWGAEQCEHLMFLSTVTWHEINCTVNNRVLEH